MALSWLKVVTKSSHQDCCYFETSPQQRTQGLTPRLLVFCVGVVDFRPSGLIVGSCLPPNEEGAENKGYICGGCVRSEGLNLFREIGATSSSTWYTWFGCRGSLKKLSAQGEFVCLDAAVLHKFWMLNGYSTHTIPPSTLPLDIFLDRRNT